MVCSRGRKSEPVSSPPQRIHGQAVPDDWKYEYMDSAARKQAIGLASLSRNQAQLVSLNWLGGHYARDRQP